MQSQIIITPKGKLMGMMPHYLLINDQMLGLIYGAPTHIYVFAPKDEPNNVKDATLVLGTMMLAAHSIGLATCWINRVDKMAETEDNSLGMFKQVLSKMFGCAYFFIHILLYLKLRNVALPPIAETSPMRNA